MGLARDEDISPEEVTRIDVDTYRIAAEHAHTGWDDFASAQLSFPYLIGLALRFRAVRLDYFGDDMRRDPVFVAIARKLTVTASPEVDHLYPQLRPAVVKVTTPRGTFVRKADEALGSRLVPLDDEGLRAKFDELAAPVLSQARAAALVEQLWDIKSCANVRPVIEAAAL